MDTRLLRIFNMPRVKINYRVDEEQIIYDDARWEILREKRQHAHEICDPLNERGIPILIYGSTARGSVNKDSDLDILVNAFIPAFQIEIALNSAGIQIIGREIVQATPSDVIKGHIYLPNDVCITVFLIPGKELNYEFYRFGGAINYQELVAGERVPGVDKSLTIIIPTEKGHKEVNLLDNEKMACDLLKISPKIIEVRKRVLSKRDKVGRTGVFIKENVDSDETFGEVLKRLSDRNSLVKRKIRR